MLARADSRRSPQAFPPPAAAVSGLGARRKTARKAKPKLPFSPAPALARLDASSAKTRPGPACFRQRLALSAAAASVARAGRAEDEAALRDALHLRPAGRRSRAGGQGLLAWRELAARSTGQWRSSFDAAAEVLGVAHDEALQEAIEAAEAGAAGDRPAPFAAARAYGLRAARPGARAAAGGRGGEGELLAAWLANSVLAQRLKWPFALPLLAAQLFSRRRRAGGAETCGDGAETTRILFAYARAAARACDLAAELARRAEKLAQAAPKLRAKGARAALRALLDDDSLSAATQDPDFRSAAREGCSTGWSRSARSANSRGARRSGFTGSKRWRGPGNPTGELDLELEDLPAPARWREWMGRVEAVDLRIR